MRSMKIYILTAYLLALSLLPGTHCNEIFLTWDVDLNRTIHPLNSDQPVITINGKFPGPLINASSNDVIHVNVFNNIDEPLLLTWNGLRQRLNSWQDGVSGTNCAIQPKKNWTYAFQAKDQIGTFSYFPSINFQKAAGGFGPIRINNHLIVHIPFPKPDDEFDLVIGDWYSKDYKQVRSMTMNTNEILLPDKILINGLGPSHATFNVTRGKTYRLRISNVGTTWSFNFRIQSHHMLLVETEGSYTNQISLDSLDVHVGQSYSVLVTANQNIDDYYIVASPKMSSNTSLSGVAILHYTGSNSSASGNLPAGPDPFNLRFSIDQAKTIRWNLTAGNSRPNPQGSFNVTNVTISQTFILRGSTARIDGKLYYTVNNVSYLTPDTPLKPADHLANGSGIYQLDQFSVNSSHVNATRGVFVASGIHKGWLELVLQNDLNVIDSWHLDGFEFYVVGFGDGKWTTRSRESYNIHDPVVRSTVQVYPGGWTAVYVYLDNPGMWNMRSQLLRNWYLGQELYLRVHDSDPNPAKELPPPPNFILCGKFEPPSPPPSPPPPSSPHGSSSWLHLSWFNVLVIFIVTALFIC